MAPHFSPLSSAARILAAATVVANALAAVPRRIAQALPGMARIATAVGCVAMLALSLPACSSSGPNVSGFALGGTRVVKVDEIVEIRMPLSESGAREWRVSSYDSLYLVVADRPRREQQSDGTVEWVIRARAVTPGDTVLELTALTPESGSPSVRRFKIKILP